MLVCTYVGEHTSTEIGSKCENVSKVAYRGGSSSRTRGDSVAITREEDCIEEICRVAMLHCLFYAIKIINNHCSQV